MALPGVDYLRLVFVFKKSHASLASSPQFLWGIDLAGIDRAQFRLRHRPSVSPAALALASTIAYGLALAFGVGRWVLATATG